MGLSMEVLASLRGIWAESKEEATVLFMVYLWCKWQSRCTSHFVTGYPFHFQGEEIWAPSFQVGNIKEFYTYFVTTTVISTWACFCRLVNGISTVGFGRLQIGKALGRAMSRDLFNHGSCTRIKDRNGVTLDSRAHLLLDHWQFGVRRRDPVQYCPLNQQMSHHSVYSLWCVFFPKKSFVQESTTEVVERLSVQSTAFLLTWLTVARAIPKKAWNRALTGLGSSGCHLAGTCLFLCYS